MNFDLLLSIVKYSGIEFSIWSDEILMSIPVATFGFPYHEVGFWQVFQEAEFFDLEWNSHDQLCEWYSIPL